MTKGSGPHALNINSLKQAAQLLSQYIKQKIVLLKSKKNKHSISQAFL